MRFELRLLWPLAILAIVGTLLLIGSLLVGARQVDSLVRHHEEFLVRRGVDGEVKAIENAIQAQTVRDEAGSVAATMDCVRCHKSPGCGVY